MSKLFLLAKANLRHEKSQAIVLFVLILLAALVLNLWLMLSMDYHANFDKRHEELNAEDAVLTLSMPKSEVQKQVDEILEDTPDVVQSELSEALLVPCLLPYNGGEVTGNMFVLPEDTAFSKDVGRIEITSQDKTVSGGMYFPVLYETEDIPLGSEAEITVNGEKRAVPVRGFMNSLMTGSHNCGITILIAQEDLYEDLKSDGIPATLVSVRTEERDLGTETAAELAEAFAEAFPDAAISSTSYASVRQSRYISQMITAGVLGAAACFILLVCVVVAASNTANRIQQTMPQLGVLKGIGYTGADLIRSFAAQYSVLSLLAGITGAALSYLAFPSIVQLMDAQTGIPYGIRFLPAPFLISVVLCWAVVVLAACFASKRIRRIEPVEAFRSGIETHSFKKNRVALISSRGPVNFALGMKSCASSGRRNFTICATMAVLTLLVCASAVLVRNVVLDVNPMLDLIGIEQADIFFDAEAEKEDEFLNLLEEDERIDRFYLYHQTENIAEPGGNGVNLIVFDDAGELNNPTTLFEGRFPEYADELALGGKHAEERGLTIGDTIELGSGDRLHKYLIVGLTQGSNYLGDEAFLTREGYLKLEDPQFLGYYVDLKEGEEAQAVMDDIRADFSGSLRSVVDISSVLDATASVYVSAIQAIVWILAGLTLVLAMLVIGLQTRTMLTARMHDYGVLKALGYRTRDLAAQTVLSFLPPVALSETAGLILWSLCMNPLLGLFMRSIGTMKCSFVIPAGLIFACGAALLGFAVLTVLVMCQRVRKISAAELVRGE